jgi:hypothetical protein
MKDGEATPMDDWRGEKKSERTYVMKDGDNLVDYLANVPVTDDSDSGEASDSILEESDTQPQPPSDPEDDHVIDRHQPIPASPA